VNQQVLPVGLKSPPGTK